MDVTISRFNSARPFRRYEHEAMVHAIAGRLFGERRSSHLFDDLSLVSKRVSCKQAPQALRAPDTRLRRFVKLSVGAQWRSQKSTAHEHSDLRGDRFRMTSPMREKLHWHGNGNSESAFPTRGLQLRLKRQAGQTLAVSDWARRGPPHARSRWLLHVWNGQ